MQNRKCCRRGQTPAAAHEALTLLSVLAGAGVALVASVLALHWTAGIGNYLHWTIAYAGQRRLPELSLMLGVYRDPSLFWTLPCVVAALVLLRSGFAKERWAQTVALALLAAPFLFTLASLLIYDDADSRGDSLLALWPLLLLLAAALAVANLLGLRREPQLRSLLPLALLAAIHGTFLSQQLWGSTYAIWPLLLLLVAELLAFLEGLTARVGSRWFVPALAALISVTLLVSGGFYTFSEERLSYANLPTALQRILSFPSSQASPRRGHICRRSTNFCATLRPTFRLTMGWFSFPARSRSTL